MSPIIQEFEFYGQQGSAHCTQAMSLSPYTLCDRRMGLTGVFEGIPDSPRGERAAVLASGMIASDFKMLPSTRLAQQDTICIKAIARGLMLFGAKNVEASWTSCRERGIPKDKCPSVQGTILLYCDDGGFALSWIGDVAAFHLDRDENRNGRAGAAGKNPQESVPKRLSAGPGEFMGPASTPRVGTLSCHLGRGESLALLSSHAEAVWLKNRSEYPDLIGFLRDAERTWFTHAASAIVLQMPELDESTEI